jgi:hypothetical protein
MEHDATRMHLTCFPKFVFGDSVETDQITKSQKNHQEQIVQTKLADSGM